MTNKQFKQLNIVRVDRHRATAFCVFHKDTNKPNLSISLEPEYYGCYKCWACGVTGKLTEVQMQQLQLKQVDDYKQRRNFRWNWYHLQRVYCDNLKRFPLFLDGLANEFNVTKQTLTNWSIGYDGRAITIPMSNNYGCIGIQRRFPDGYKCCVDGSRLGLFINTGFADDDIVYICEGFSDAVAVYDLGFQVIGRPNCKFTKYIEDIFFEADGEFYGEIVIIPDNDEVGLLGANELADILADYFNVYLFTFDGAKDIREYIKLKGKDYVRKELETYG